MISHKIEPCCKAVLMWQTSACWANPVSPPLVPCARHVASLKRSQSAWQRKRDLDRIGPCLRSKTWQSRLISVHLFTLFQTKRHTCGMSVVELCGIQNDKHPSETGPRCEECLARKRWLLEASTSARQFELVSCRNMCSKSC